MSIFRVPYPTNSENRRALFERAAALLVGHGTFEGTPDGGTFQGTTPLGRFAGRYRAIDHSGELEIELTKKPWLVSTHLVEHEVRKLLQSA